MAALYVGLGGFFGAIARYYISGWVQSHARGDFPTGTLTVNALGCLVIGVVMTLIEDRSLFPPQVRWCVVTGFLGALTTYSTFGFETLQLIRDMRMGLAVANVLLNTTIALAAVYAGRTLVRSLI